MYTDLFLDTGFSDRHWRESSEWIRCECGCWFWHPKTTNSVAGIDATILAESPGLFLKEANSDPFALYLL